MPEGYKECIQEYDDGNEVKLDKAIYGLDKEAKQFW